MAGRIETLEFQAALLRLIVRDVENGEAEAPAQSHNLGIFGHVVQASVGHREDSSTAPWIEPESYDGIIMRRITAWTSGCSHCNQPILRRESR